MALHLCSPLPRTFPGASGGFSSQGRLGGWSCREEKELEGVGALWDLGSTPALPLNRAGAP